MKLISLALLALGAILSIILYMTGHLTSPVPLDSSLCPDTVQKSADGTCGVYVGSRLSLGTVACIVAGGAGIVLYIVSAIVERRNAIR